MSKNPPKPDPNWDFDPENVTGNYILKHRKPVECPNLYKWGKFIHRNHRKKRVRSTYIGDWWVSTVFLFIEHGLPGDMLLFETMVFKKDDEKMIDNYYERTTSWRKALKQHWQIVEKFKNEL